MPLLLGSTSISLGKSDISGNFSLMIGKFHEFNYVVNKYDNSSALPPAKYVAKWPGWCVVLFFAMQRVKSRMIG